MLEDESCINSENKSIPLFYEYGNVIEQKLWRWDTLQITKYIYKGWNVWNLHHAVTIYVCRIELVRSGAIKPEKQPVLKLGYIRYR